MENFSIRGLSVVLRISYITSIINIISEDIYIYNITLVMDIDYWLFFMFFHRHIYRDINALNLILGYITQGMNYCGYIYKDT